MTPKNKAIELVGKFKNFVAIDYKYDEEPIFELQKKSALIAVEELINDFRGYRLKSFLTLNQAQEAKKYWEEVKEEINAL